MNHRATMGGECQKRSCFLLEFPLGFNRFLLIKCLYKDLLEHWCRMLQNDDGFGSSRHSFSDHVSLKTRLAVPCRVYLSSLRKQRFLSASPLLSFVFCLYIFRFLPFGYNSSRTTNNPPERSSETNLIIQSELHMLLYIPTHHHHRPSSPSYSIIVTHPHHVPTTAATSK
jgi:hypothetical protein